ncbi:hypothetical protein [Streptosporangium sp. NPDC002524]|uniref:hypothetical protein n=1 Tax=Streptosporangium sp. NPDC002524 TaxID=3154537 RepID=UPI003324D914
MAGEHRFQIGADLGGEGEGGDPYARPGLGVGGRGGQQRRSWCGLQVSLPGTYLLGRAEPTTEPIEPAVTVVTAPAAVLVAVLVFGGAVGGPWGPGRKSNGYESDLR